LQLYPWNNSCFLGMQYCSYSVLAIYGTCATSRDKRSIRLT
jgi:hypothetical protein